MSTAHLRGEYLHPTLSGRFLTEMHEAGKYRSLKTVETYATVYKKLQEHYPELRANEILTEENVVAWFRAHAGDWKENTVASYRKALLNIVRWGARQGICDDFSDALKERVQVDIRNHRVNNWLEPEDLTQLLKVCDPATTAGERDGMLIRTAALTGLRCSELCDLRWTHVDFRNGIIHVENGKGNKPRDVGLLPELAPALRDWKSRAAEDLGAIPTIHPVLPRVRQTGALAWDYRSPRKLSQQDVVGKVENPIEGLADIAVFRRVQFRGRQIGIEHLGPHDLRRTFAGLLEAAGVPVQEIAAQLGHSSVDTTIRYLASNPRKRASAMAGVRFGI